MTRTIALTLALATPALAAAQTSDELRAHTRRESPEHFAFELKVGTYRPDARAVDGTNAWSTFFGGDRGPLLQLELDVFAWRIPYVGLIGAGVSAGWARYQRGLCADPSCAPQSRLDEKGRAKLFPVAGLAVLRVDALARELGVPLVVTGKIGLDAVFYRITGGSLSGSGSSLGMRWAVQLALELDFINRARARTLDDEWGINHTTLFVELFGSTADSSIDLGTGLAWTLGLGLTF